MALQIVKVNLRYTEADGAGVCRNIAGRPQPGDPRFQNGDITAAEHMLGTKSSGIPAADLNSLGGRQANIYYNYEDALAFGSDGLVTDMETVNRLTNAATGTVIDQSPPDDPIAGPAGMVGVPIDINGDMVVAIDDGGEAAITVFVMTLGGRQNGPIPVVVSAPTILTPSP